MKIVKYITAVSILALTACATTSPPPKTAEEGWQSASRMDSASGYEYFLKKHPNSQFDEQAKNMLAEALKRQEERRLEIQKKAKELQNSGGKVWEFQNVSTGETVLVYKGMTVQEVKEAGLNPMIPSGFENYDINAQDPVSGRVWIFKRGRLVDVRE